MTSRLPGCEPRTRTGIAPEGAVKGERQKDMSTEVSPYDDVIDIRDVIARYEDLRDRCSPDGIEPEGMTDEERDELRALGALLDECKGNGGDEQWRGDWYPVTLIRDSYFREYAQELAEDIGAINPDAGWPYSCIDWEQAARELRMDYTPVEFDGVTYWVR